MPFRKIWLPPSCSATVMGAFTGAESDKVGLLQEADRGHAVP